jgi:DNA-binding response OmpR family regulator
MATVLVVDDEPDIVLFAQINLEMSGYEVRSAVDGEAALAAIDEARPDLVLLDVMMPGLDGWAVLERIKAHPDEAVRTVPVVMMTALGSDQDQARGGIEGAVRHLVKPVTPDDLLAAVDAALTGDPEPVQRRRAQQGALTRLARAERAESGDTTPAATGRSPRLTRLERARTPAPGADGAPHPVPVDLAAVQLTDKQRELLDAIRAAPSVRAAADALGTSRSNVYASLRRIGRRVGLTDVSALLARIRDDAPER